MEVSKRRRPKREAWKDEPASPKQIAYIKAIKEMRKGLPFIDYHTATKWEASKYIRRYWLKYE